MSTKGKGIIAVTDRAHCQCQVAFFKPMSYYFQEKYKKKKQVWTSNKDESVNTKHSKNYDEYT